MKYLVLLSVLLLGVTACQMTVSKDDDAIFLSMGQRADLVMFGEVCDSDSNIYSVYVIPGYVSPFRLSGEYMEKSYKELKEYIRPTHYQKDLDHLDRCYVDLVVRECLVNLAYKKTIDAWSENFANATNAFSKRLMGSTFAYPSAFLLSLGETLVYVPGGFIGASCVSAYGLFIPVHMIAAPLVKSTCVFTTAILAPVAGIAWNTVAAPPTALFAFRPSLDRVDGNLVKVTMFNNEERKSKMIQSTHGLIKHAKTKMHYYNEQIHQLNTLTLMHQKIYQGYSDSCKEVERLFYKESNPELEKLFIETASQFKSLSAKDIEYIVDLILENEFFSEEYYKIKMRQHLIDLFKKYYAEYKDQKQKFNSKHRRSEKFNPIVSPHENVGILHER